MATAEIVRGTTFSVSVESERPIQSVREDAKKRFGRAIHIRVKIGPATRKGDVLTFPIEAIDDSFLNGSFGELPKKDHYLLVGYFK